MKYKNYEKGGIFVRIYEDGQTFIGFGKDGVRSVWLSRDEVEWVASLYPKKSSTKNI